jgi:hypothetical protein
MRMSILRVIVPMLALVWATLPWHPCQQAAASEPAATTTIAQPAAAHGSPQLSMNEDCGHCPPAESAPHEPSLHCLDVEKNSNSKDMRLADVQSPAAFVPVLFVHAAEPVERLERAEPPARKPARPLHLEKSVLLI